MKLCSSRVFQFPTPPHLPRWTMDKFLVCKKDSKAPPAPDMKVLHANLPPLQYTCLSLVPTWAQILFGVLQVTGPHCWFCCALGCILGITVFSPYVETIVEHCIDKILLVFKVMGVKLVKGGETYVDHGDKQPTESPTYIMFGLAMHIHDGTHMCWSGANRAMYHFLLQESVWMCQSETRGTRFVWRLSSAWNP